MLAHRSGEAESVVKDVVTRYGNWFEEDAGGVKVTDVGLAALATEWDGRHTRSTRADTDQADCTETERFEKLTSARPPARRELDQVWATSESVLARARMLIEEGEVQRGLVLLGDDDLTSLALGTMGASRGTTVLDLDGAVLAFIDAQSATFDASPVTRAHDFRDPIPARLRGKFGCAFTDPPYAPAGFRLFLDRAIWLTRPDARIYASFGSSRRAPERGLQKQAIVQEAGLLIERVLPDFHVYRGAEAIGSRSDLWVLRKTPSTKRLSPDGHTDGELYTSRRPQ